MAAGCTGAGGGSARAAEGPPECEGSPERGARLDPEFPEDFRRRAKAGERGLQQVQPDKDRQQEPPDRDPVNQGRREQNHRSGESQNRTINCHGRFLSLVRCHYIRKAHEGPFRPRPAFSSIF